MPEPDEYAADQAATLRDDWQFSRIFMRENARPGFTALLALRAEMQQVLAQARDAGVVAMKLEWWRGEIERGFDGNAQHPLARALGIHLGKCGGAAEYCHEIVDAAETESEDERAATEQDFRLYLYRSGGVLAEQLAMLSGTNDRNALNAARRLGQSKRFTDMLLACGAMLRAGRWLFPLAWLEECDLDSRTLHENHNDPRVTELLYFMLNALDRERIETRTAMENTELPPALFLQWPLAQRDYQRMRANPVIMLAAQPMKGNSLARLWTAWRGVRKSVRRGR